MSIQSSKQDLIQSQLPVGTSSGKIPIVPIPLASVNVTLATVATSGSYADLSGRPSLGTQMSVDTGWTAATATPDKTVVLADYSNGVNGTMVTALNLVSAGTGTAIAAGFDQVVVLTKQVAALRAILLAAKLPNA